MIEDKDIIRSIREKKEVGFRLLMQKYKQSIYFSPWQPSIALVLVIHMNFSKQRPTTINDVDQAFSQLTTDDQVYLVNVYQEDVFINE